MKRCSVWNKLGLGRWPRAASLDRCTVCFVRRNVHFWPFGYSSLVLSNQKNNTVVGAERTQTLHRAAMGLSSSQLYAADFPNSTMFPKDIQWHFVDENHAGDVSVAVFKNESNDRTLAHQAIFIDVEGASRESLLHGVMIHLLADPSTKITKFGIKDHRWKKDAFDGIIPVGRLQPSRPSPYCWAADLKRQVISDVFNWGKTPRWCVWLNHGDTRYITTWLITTRITSGHHRSIAKCSYASGWRGTILNGQVLMSPLQTMVFYPLSSMNQSVAYVWRQWRPWIDLGHWSIYSHIFGRKQSFSRFLFFHQNVRFLSSIVPVINEQTMYRYLKN